jgi:hypothetical protein
MTRPLRSTPITGASPLLRAGPPARRQRRQRAFPCSMREPQTRLMPPLCRTPPGQSSGTRQVLLPQPGAWPRFRCPFVNVTTRQQRFGFTHLPGPHLALHRCLFHIAHHDGLQPTQHVVVWSLPPKGDSEGPTFISRTAPTPGVSPTSSRPPFVVHSARPGVLSIRHDSSDSIHAAGQWRTLLLRRSGAAGSSTTIRTYNS